MSDLISRSALLETLKDVEVAWYMDGNYTIDLLYFAF